MLRRVVLIVLATLALNTAIAAMLVAFGLSSPFLPTLVQSQAIGLTIAALCWGVSPWVARAGGAPAVAMALYGVAIAAGSIGGSVLARVLNGGRPTDLSGALAQALGFDGPAGRRTLLISLLAGTLATLYFYGRERLHHARTAAESERWRALAAERSAAQAQLQALRAQVEPHFLFNTLANVSALIERDPAAARALIDDLSRHLRSTLRHARARSTTLGRELEVTASLLGIMKRRLGDRLQWRFDVPDALRTLPVAPMLVQPLVENAVKHGIEPQVAGGSIEVRARCDATGLLTVEVADTGRGFAAGGEPDGRDDASARTGHPTDTTDSSGAIDALDAAVAADSDGAGGAGTGLANLGQRLRAIYGPGARLALLDNAPRGTVARLTLPPLPAGAIDA
jgi:signal transduction histidine kinase